MVNTALCEEDERVRQAMAQGVDEVIDGLSFDDVADIRVTLPDGRTAGVREAVKTYALGGTLDMDGLLAALFRILAEQTKRLGGVMLEIMLPVLLTGILSQTFMASGNTLAETGRSLGFLVVLLPLGALVVGQLENAKTMILTLTERMERLLPLMLTLLTAVGGSASSAFLHPAVAVASGSMVFLARGVILRLVMCTCAVTLVNHLSEKAHLTRMAALLRSMVCWLLGVSFTVFVGALGMQGLASAAADGVAIRAAKYAADNFVPVVGGMFSDTMDMLVGCALVVKNAMGLTTALVLAGTVAAPMLGSVAAVFMLKACAALLEPVAGAGVVSAIGDVGRSIVLLTITMLCVGTMYFMLIAQILLVGNLTVMLR